VDRWASTTRHDGERQPLYTFSQLWWVFPTSIVFSTVAIGSVVAGALFFSPFFMLVVGLTPVQAVGAGPLTEVLGMGNGLRSYVKAGPDGPECSGTGPPRRALFGCVGRCCPQGPPHP